MDKEPEKKPEIKKPEEQHSAAPAELTKEELDKVAGGTVSNNYNRTVTNNNVNRNVTNNNVNNNN